MGVIPMLAFPVGWGDEMLLKNKILLTCRAFVGLDNKLFPICFGP